MFTEEAEDDESEEITQDSDASEGLGLDEGSEESESELGLMGPSAKCRRRMSQWEAGVQRCFRLIPDGKLDDAVAFDAELSKIKLSYLPDPSGFLQEVASCESFKETHAAHTPQCVQALLDWAKAQPADSWPGAKPRMLEFLEMDRGPRLPDGISKDLYNELLEARATHLKECLVGQPKDVQKLLDGLLRAPMDWTKVESVLHKRLQDTHAHASSIRSKPLSQSASIALYSPELRKEELSGFPAHSRAILGCCLISHQCSWRRTGKSEFAAPLELHARGISHMDLGGDVVAFWGNREVDEIRSEDWVLGYTRVAPSMGGDLSGRHGLPLPKHSWISGLHVESGIEAGVDRIWAGDSRNRRIWAVDVNSKQNLLELSLPHSCTEGPMGMARFGMRLLAVAGTPEVFAWNVEEGLSQPAEPAPAKRAKKMSRKPTATAARSTLHFQNAFPLRQCQKLSPSHCLLAASEGGEESEYDSANHASMHIVDVEAQKTVALLCGHRSAPDLNRQLCAESHSLVFSVDSGGLALAFDVRTSLPVLRLSGLSSSTAFEQHQGILGVPVGSSCVAFTHAYDECIRAWDIRSGDASSHVWTASTGNLNIKGLAWHAPSSSLFACNYSNHTASYGRCGVYGYDGDDLSFGGRMTDDDGWPRKPLRPREFFPQAYHAEEDCLLRYMFDRPRVAPLFDLCAKSMRTLDGVPDSLRSMVCSARAFNGSKAL